LVLAQYRALLHAIFLVYWNENAMNEPRNPYAAPSASLHASEQSDVLPPTPAGQGARFANFVIDYLAQLAIGFVVGVLIMVIGGQEGADFIEQIPGLFIGTPIFLVYYFVFEATTSRTLGKLITGTKVVNQDGRTPTLGQIAGRTFCRLIPFEAFSFLGALPRGWHDSVPKTFVVKTR
jgi:uncharacterized RDD family membrane protein YckC